MPFVLFATCAIFVIFSAASCAQEQPEVMAYNQYHSHALAIDHKKHEIDVYKFLELLEKENVVVLDLNSEAEYARKHIKGAIHIGADITAENLEKIIPSKETIILTYCRNSFGAYRSMSMTDIVLPQIIHHGYINVFKLERVWGNYENFESIINNLPWVGEDIR